MKGALRNNSLSIFFGVLFLLALLGQALTGLALYNKQQVSSGLERIGLGRYITSSVFAVDVSENWQSEYLQFLLYIFATVWFVQQGSPESKDLDKTGRESDKDQKIGKYAQAGSPAWAKAGGWRLAIFSRSLGLTMGAIFLGSWLVQFLTGRVAYNDEQLGNYQDPVGYAEYFSSPDFWNRTLQNWQSEFLAVGSMVVLSIFLRQRGSPESKPVGAEHSATAEEG